MKEKQQPEDWQKLFQPLLDITDINTKAVQKFAELQSNYLNYLFEANIRQFKALTEIKDVKSAVEQQLEFVKEVDTKWCDMAEQEIATARDAQQSINDMLEKSYANGSDFLEQFSPPPAAH
ncbi:phasin family protein [Motiliproteus sp. MSK22-1]|uniref:phasin family protein n=1 Tax=Motiliproteus sp. MSK22-1 TaxID=1897630 RepID=UPI0009766477|nr:phasin family protein [Motiliproteus sp. MSK22-1]OMH25573.1 hypothetical protein BGP75_23765 [Motiliproteus sp. MSK22-1]